MKRLVAVDWGTSSLRAALLDGQGAVLGERSLPRGILTVQAGGFSSVLQDACGDWLRPTDTLCLISGMAGSRQGWIEAPYCGCPAGFAEISAQLAWIEPGRIAVVPGLSRESDGVPDVMRGEETQVLGALRLLGIDDGLMVLPGTHSKWVRVARGRIEHFSTWMSGEFYALLRQHSILARTLPEADGELDAEAFTRGVDYARQCGNLLHSTFSARTLALFDRLPALSIPSYLSGLVIGEELRSQSMDAAASQLVLIGTAELTRRYELALRSFGLRAFCVGSEATWRGLWAIALSLRGLP